MFNEQFFNSGKLVKKGQVGFRFLENPVSAEAIGRGGLGLPYSKKVSDRFSFGVRSKYAYQDLGSVLTGSVIMGDTTISLKDYYQGEPAIDIGTTYDFLNHGIRFGAVMQNFSRELKYEIEKFPMPFSVSFSLSLNMLSLLSIADETHSLVVGFETNHPGYYLEKIKIGAEYSYLQLLLLRTGYMGNYDERGLTFGMGIRKMVASTQIRLDYAYQDFGIFDATHTFSIGVSY